MKLNTSKDWLPFIPLDKDVQVSKTADFQACGSFSAIHIAEILIRYNTGQFWEFSERALAKLSGTTSQGNSLTNIINAIKQYGLILDQDWEQMTYSDNYEDITWQQFYAPIPLNVQKKAYPFDIVSFRKITSGEVDACLQVAPLWTIINVGTTNHIVAQLNKTQYYDSYEVRVKNFQPSQPIVSQYQLILNPKLMTNAKLIKNGNEYGFYLPATSEQELIGKALNFGLPLPTTDNGTKVDWPNLKPDITL